MDRRNALIALTGVAAGAALLGTTRLSLAAAATENLSPDGYRTRTLLVGTLAKETAQLGEQRAQNPRVKQFAQFEVAEQTAVAEVLTDSNNPTPPTLDAQHAAMLKQLQAQNGSGFDRAFIQGQLTGHQELLAIQNGYLNAAPGDRDLVHIAVLARASIMQHIVMLQDLQTMLGAA